MDILLNRTKFDPYTKPNEFPLFDWGSVSQHLIKIYLSIKSRTDNLAQGGSFSLMFACDFSFHLSLENCRTTSLLSLKKNKMIQFCFGEKLTSQLDLLLPEN